MYNTEKLTCKVVKIGFHMRCGRFFRLFLHHMTPVRLAGEFVKHIALFFRRIAAFLPTLGCIARSFAGFIEMQIIFLSILNVRCHAMNKCTCLPFVFDYSMAFVFIVDSYHIEDLICNC